MEKRNKTYWETVKLCHHFNETKICPYGDACIFAHGLSDSRPPPKTCNQWRAKCPYAPRDPLIREHFDRTFCCRVHAAANAHEAVLQLRKNANHVSPSARPGRRRQRRVPFYAAPTSDPYARVSELKQLSCSWDCSM